MCFRFFCLTQTRRDIGYGHLDPPIDPFDVETELIGVKENMIQAHVKETIDIRKDGLSKFRKQEHILQADI